ncbi:hypothetical protein ABVV53_13165 [Novosphingobium sp. RD2P27]|uniref:CBS domain-containing protein n=1 Tax=Novosphingobium kalidii TaxID=3230299 RepID=A0ABV2D3E1_9SPHN
MLPSLAPFVAGLLPILITALGPIVWASRQFTKLITLGKPADLPHHREELLALTSPGQASGQLENSEARFMKNMLQLYAVRASDIMTPRTVVFSLPLQSPLAEFARAIGDVPYTRIPLFDGKRDNIQGFVVKHEVLARSHADEDLAKFMRRCLRACPSTSYSVV